MISRFQTIILITLISATITQTPKPYCSTACIDSIGACFDDTPTGCYVCAQHVFSMIPTLNTSCPVANQTSIVANQLPSPAMDLTGYSSSKMTPFVCSNYTFSGQYAASDFISKNFTGIPLNHYALVVRFGVGYIGSWSDTDFLRLSLQDQSQTVNYDYKYSCDTPQTLCSGGNNTDCIRIREYTLVHNTSYLALKFSALTTQTNTAIQSWGIKELIVAAKKCHSYCDTCYGPNNTNCITCASGFYLQGNVCLKSCDPGFYLLPVQNVCVAICPTKYFSSSMTNGTLICKQCAVGCQICSSQKICQAYSDQSAYVPNLWNDKLQFWIVLILLSLGVIIFVVYRVLKKSLPTDLQQKMVNSDQKKDDSQKGKEEKKSTQQKEHGVQKITLNQSVGPTMELSGGDNLWFNELVQLEATQVKVRGKRRKTTKSPPQLSVASNNQIDAASNAQL